MSLSYFFIHSMTNLLKTDSNKSSYLIGISMVILAIILAVTFAQSMTFVEKCNVYNIMVLREQADGSLITETKQVCREKMWEFILELQ